MNCSACNHENPPGARFCNGCGAALALCCASCNAENPPGSRFCNGCGAALEGTAPAAPSAPPAEPAGTRKIVTIVFADLAGSTAMQERLDPESVRLFMESYYDAMREAVESHGGTVTQFLGDGVKAVFGIPRVAEDDAMRAVRAGMAMQKSFQALAENQRGAVGAVGLRVAVNTGEVVANADDEIIGDPVNVAARLQEQAGNGDVVVGDSTARLVEALVTLAPLGSFALKGRAESVAAFLVESLDAPASAATAAFVGRDEELIRLTLVYEGAVEKPATSLAVLLGSPGLGKSRLIEEFSHRLGESAKVVEAHCDQANGATFAPIAVALRGLLGIDVGASGEALKEATLAVIPEDDRDRERIAIGIAALLAGSPGSLEETFFVVRRLFASLASERPLILVIDDLQWAEPLLLDLVEHLVQWGSGVQMLVLVGARPELREKRASLIVPGGLVADVVTLAGLDAGAAMRLAANVIGADNLPAAVAAKVLATSEGNPLFVGELVRMLVHEGALKREGDRWTTGTALAALEMPPTIHALLAARIERLQPQERLILERASIVGRHFSRSAVLELLPPGVSDLDVHLETLRRSELIERDTGWFFGEPVLRFHHVLIRDAAYRQLLKGTRAELHTRFGDWALARAEEGSAEHDETIGWHLEQAHQFLRELGPIDAEGRVIGERASRHLAAAGTRALAGDDVSLAGSLLGRAIDRLDPADEARAELALDWCEALLAAGDVGPAALAIEELDRFVGDSDRLRAWHTCFAGQHTVLTAPEGLQSTADAVAAAADALAALDDAAGEAKAHYVYALALSSLGKIGACEAALDRALAAARRVAGDRRRANTVLAIAPLAALSGPSPVTRASGRCLDVVRVLRITQGAPAVEAVALSCQGVLEALRGRTEAARRMIASARTMVEELGITQRLLEVDVFSGQVDLLEGDAIAAEASLRGAYDGLRDLGLGIDAAKAAALLARALLAQNRDAEAEALSLESEALAGDDLKAAIAWRGVRAEALARRGEHADAVAFASKAVEIAAATDALLDHADARLALAAALRAAGRGREADVEEHRAHELWEAKGATLLAERPRSEVVAAVPAPAPATAPVAPTTAARRVSTNAAMVAVGRYASFVAARDFASARALCSDDYVETEHSTGSSYGPDQGIESLERLYRSRDPDYGVEPLAVLGDSLALVWRTSRASGAQSKHYDVGQYEHQAAQVLAVDEDGLLHRSEVFSTARLSDAIVRLYELYAESLPEGPARTRAATIARSVAAWISPFNFERLEETTAPSCRMVDHRVLATWESRDAAELLQHVRVQTELAPDFGPHVDDIRALEPDCFLFRMTYGGHASASGGYFGNEVLMVHTFGGDGRLSHMDDFEAEAEAEAMARFEELGAPTEAVANRRRVRPNRATEAMSRLEAAFIARDFDAMREIFDEGHSAVEHATGASFGIQGALASSERLSRAQDPYLEYAPLATLGEDLALARRRTGATGTVTANYDVGAHQIEAFNIIEVDSQGLVRLSEIFADTHLADAVTRLYERFAELLPEGAERDLGRAIARTIASLLGPPSLESLSSTGSPALELVDHRILGYGNVGGEAFLENIRAMFELEDFVIVVNDILCARPSAVLLRTTTEGTARLGGGAYERSMLQIWLFGDDGLLMRSEFFDVERDAEALARFNELTSPAPSEEHFANMASRLSNRLLELWLGGDWDGVLELFADEFVCSDRRRLALVNLDREAFVAALRTFGDMESTRLESQLIATRGARLALFREGIFVEGGDVGPSETSYLRLLETDARGVATGDARFDEDDLEAAYAELDARFEAGEAAVRPRGIGATQRLDRGLRDRDWDAAVECLAPSFKYRDHRVLGFGSTTDDPAKWLRSQQALVELAPDASYRDHHLRVSEGAVLRHLTQSGTRDGGAFENTLLAVVDVDEQGKIVSMDAYDIDKFDAARAQFDALTATVSTRGRFENAASRATQRLLGAWQGDAWDRVDELLSADYHLSNRCRSVQLEMDRNEALVFHRALGEQVTTRGFSTELLATRGENLALLRWRLEVSGDSLGQSEMVQLNLAETNEAGQVATLVRWDEDELGASYAELDARFEAGEAAAHPHVIGAIRALTRGLLERDWDAVDECLSPGFNSRDHQLLGSGSTLNDAAKWVRSQRALVELAPDVAYRADHLRLSERGALRQITRYGTRDGGAFENTLLTVSSVDEQGKIISIDAYDIDKFDEARAGFDSLTTDVPIVARFDNAAVRAGDEAQSAWMDGDEERLRQSFPAGFTTYSDRRRMVQLDFDREEMIRFSRELGKTATTRRIHSEPLATRGERLALQRARVEIAGGDVGASELVYLTLLETDERGELSAGVRWDEDQLDAAYAELDARFEAGEAAAHPQCWAVSRDFVKHVAARDWDAMAAGCTEDFVEYDHRSLAVLGTTHGRDAWVQNFSALVELASDTIYRVHHYVAADRGYYVHGGWYGQQAGGTYEMPLNAVAELDDRGLMVRADIYDDSLDAALARLAELAVPAASAVSIGSCDGPGLGAALAKSNPASIATHRLHAAWKQGIETGDFESMRSLCSPDLVFEDRQRMALLRGDREMFVASGRERRVAGAQMQMEQIGTAGDRVAMCRVLWTGGPSEGRFEVEYLSLIEVDEAGLAVAVIHFNIDDRVAVQREAWARWAAADPNVTAVITPIGQTVDAFNEQDAEKWRAQYADDLVVVDHRLAGMGRVDGADTYTESLVALWELAPVTQAESGWVWPAFDHYGGITIVCRTGTVPDGGGDFESDTVFLFLVNGGRITRVELFEVSALDEALARFKELGADPLLIPPNAASHAQNRCGQDMLTADWEMLRSRVRPDFIFEDRGKRALVTGDIETWIESAKFTTSLPGVMPKTSIVGTVGERISLSELNWHGSSDGDAFDVWKLRLTEVDADGLLRAMILFDPDEREAAFSEAYARFRAGEAAGSSAQQVVDELLHAWATNDWSRLRDGLAEVSVIDDHRPLSFGRIGRDQWIESTRVLFEMAPDTSGDWSRILAWNEHGRVWLGRVYGTRDGGAFENVFVLLLVADAICARHFEFFAAEDADHAIARFEELCHARAGTTARVAALPAAFQNAATRTVANATAAEGVRDWEGFASTLAPNFRSYDRRALVQIESDRETWLESYREITEMTTSQPIYEVLATRGERLAIVQMLWQGGQGDIGPSEIEWLLVIEVDEREAHTAVVTFDPGDVTAAYAELDARWSAGEAALHPRASAWMAAFLRGFASRDWSGLAGLGAPDEVAINHRLVGWGTQSGKGAWVPTLQALVDLAEDTEFCVHHVRTCASGLLVQFDLAGTRDGGAYEIPEVMAVELNERGESVQIDVWDEDNLDEALARFEELRPDPLRIPPNAATRALRQIGQARATGDIEALREFVTDDFLFDDRKHRALVRGGIEEWIRALQFLWVETRAQHEARTLVVRGDRLALDLVRWTEAPGEGAFEMEGLRLVEVDEHGKLCAMIFFDGDDRAAAHAELLERHIVLGADGLPAGVLEFSLGVNERDLVRARRGLCDDLAVDDHRWTGMGLLEGADRYMESVRAMHDLMPEGRTDSLYTLRSTPRGQLFVTRTAGVNSEGGEFESIFFVLMLYREEKIARMEYFELEHQADAIARFEELAADGTEEHE